MNEKSHSCLILHTLIAVDKSNLTQPSKTKKKVFGTLLRSICHSYHYEWWILICNVWHISFFISFRLQNNFKWVVMLTLLCATSCLVSYGQVYHLSTQRHARSITQVTSSYCTKMILFQSLYSSVIRTPKWGLPANDIHWFSVASLGWLPFLT